MSKLALQLPDAFAAYEWAVNYANNNGLGKPAVTGHSLGGALSQLQGCK